MTTLTTVYLTLAVGLLLWLLSQPPVWFAVRLALGIVGGPMSAIYFHSPNGTANVRGSERASFGTFCTRLTWAILEPYADESPASSPLRKVFPTKHHVLRSSNFEIAARAFILAGGLFGSPLRIYGQDIDVFSLSVNTALAAGNDAVKLAARLHAQCEIHTYVEGHNRRWLADIIRQGRASSFYHDGMGWNSVIELLDKDDASPIVTSYSVTDTFPNPDAAGIESINDDDDPWERFEAMSVDERWALAMAGLRNHPEMLLELQPEGWSDVRLHPGFDAWELIRHL